MLSEAVDTLSWYAEILHYKMREEDSYDPETRFDLRETPEGYEARFLSPDKKRRERFDEAEGVVSFYNDLVDEEADTRIGDYDEDPRGVVREMSAGKGKDGEWVVDVFRAVNMFWNKGLNDEVRNATRGITSVVLEEVTHAHSDYTHRRGYAVEPQQFSDLRGIQEDLEKCIDIKDMRVEDEHLLVEQDDPDSEDAPGLVREAVGNLENTRITPFQIKDEGDEVFKEMAEHVTEQ